MIQSKLYENLRWRDMEEQDARHRLLESVCVCIHCFCPFLRSSGEPLQNGCRAWQAILVPFLP